MGGTVDKQWSTGNDATVYPRDCSAILDYFDKAHIFKDKKDMPAVNTVCMKESADVNEGDRQQLVRILEVAKQKQIIIVHGTKTDEMTAQYIRDNLKRKDQIIVFFGSDTPMDVIYSPTHFWLGVAMGKVQAEKTSGIYFVKNA